MIITITELQFKKCIEEIKPIYRGEDSKGKSIYSVGNIMELHEKYEADIVRKSILSFHQAQR